MSTYNRSKLQQLIDDYPNNIPAYLEGVALDDYTDSDIQNILDDIEASTGEVVIFEFDEE